MISEIKVCALSLCTLLLFSSSSFGQIAISSLDGASHPKEGQKVTYSAQVSAQNESAITYSWDFADGSAVVSGISRAAVSHVYKDQGDFELVLTVTSADGFSDTSRKSIEEYDQSYTLEIKKGVESSLGLGLKEDFKYTFRTQKSPFAED